VGKYIVVLNNSITNVYLI